MARVARVVCSSLTSRRSSATASTARSRTSKRECATDPRRRPFLLADAQHLIAEAHGYESWGAFAQYVEDAEGTRPARRFRARRRRGRQRRPRDARVARAQEPGADPRAISARPPRDASPLRGGERRRRFSSEDAEERGGDRSVSAGGRIRSGRGRGNVRRRHWQTTMNLLVSSAHPAGAGLMPALVDVLVDYGAATNGVGDDESPMMTALDFGYGDAAETLARRGARVDNVVTAAALGRLDLVRRFMLDKRTLAPGVPLVAPRWRNLPDDPTAHRARAGVGVQVRAGRCCRIPARHRCRPRLEGRIRHDARCTGPRRTE